MKVNTELSDNTPGDWLMQFLTAKRYSLVRLVGVIVLLIIPFLSMKKWGEFSGIIDHLDWMTSYLIMTSIFYINIYLLVPKLLYRGKAAFYLFALSVAIGIGLLSIIIIQDVIFEGYRLIPRANPEGSIFAWLTFILLLTPFYLVSTALKLLQRWVSDSERLNGLEKYAMQSELKALRNQIQPHFLFNMLNGILVINRQDPQLASKVIIKLSHFLRYLLYESNHIEVFLTNEINFIIDFLELEKIRRDNFTFEVKYNVNDVINVKIPPHILLTIMENAVKHSVDSEFSSTVILNLDISENKLTIGCKNSISTENIETGDGGIGLTNMARRLELLFPNQFEYEVLKFDKYYTVNLTIPI